MRRKFAAPILMSFLVWFMWVHQAGELAGSDAGKWKKIGARFHDRASCTRAIGQQLKARVLKVQSKDGKAYVETAGGSALAVVSDGRRLLAWYHCFGEGSIPAGSPW
ncbi:MAG: hypothetical protein O2807_06415 [bacterium]|nr:hypothetical protein [bacterium]